LVLHDSRMTVHTGSPRRAMEKEIEMSDMSPKPKPIGNPTLEGLGATQQQIVTALTTLKSKYLPQSLDEFVKPTLRPWIDFASLEKPQKVDLKATVRNLSFYRWNYLAVDSVIITLGLLMNPTALLCLVMLVISWIVFLAKNNDWNLNSRDADITVPSYDLDEWHVNFFPGLFHRESCVNVVRVINSSKPSP